MASNVVLTLRSVKLVVETQLENREGKHQYLSITVALLTRTFMQLYKLEV